jgi:hypothetical protein
MQDVEGLGLHREGGGHDGDAQPPERLNGPCPLTAKSGHLHAAAWATLQRSSGYNTGGLACTKVRESLETGYIGVVFDSKLTRPC